MRQHVECGTGIGFRAFADAAHPVRDGLEPIRAIRTSCPHAKAKVLGLHLFDFLPSKSQT